VSHEGVFGADKEKREMAATFSVRERGRTAQSAANMNVASPTAPPPPPNVTRKSPSIAGGDSRGVGGGIGTGKGGGAGPGTGAGVGAGTGIGTGRADSAKPLTPGEQKRRQMLAKLHPSIVAVIERLNNKSARPAADEAKFVRSGKAEIQIWLTDKSPAAIEQLKKLGFEVVLDPQSAKMIIGRVPIEKLAELAELTIVRYVAPMTTN
jgi:hypothetical protein